jgi:hypothetical protein
MLNLIITLISIVTVYYLIKYLDTKFRDGNRPKALALTYKCLEPYDIVDFKELNDSMGTPYEAGGIEPDFTPNSNLLSSRFYFRVTVKSETETLTKWVYAYYFMNLQIRFDIKP